MSLSKLKFKNRWFPALMNLIGLGIAFSIFLILLSQVWWDYRYDRFNGSDQVYVVEAPGFREGLYSTTLVRPAVQMIADCSPDIAISCNYEATRNDRTGIIQIKDAGGEYSDAAGDLVADQPEIPADCDGQLRHCRADRNCHLPALAATFRLPDQYAGLAVRAGVCNCHPHYARYRCPSGLDGSERQPCRID